MTRILAAALLTACTTTPEPQAVTPPTLDTPSTFRLAAGQTSTERFSQGVDLTSLQVIEGTEVAGDLGFQVNFTRGGLNATLRANSDIEAPELRALHFELGGVRYAGFLTDFAVDSAEPYSASASVTLALAQLD